ncbi:MAG: hypothetical protein MJ078_01570 [Clostridia bacterium]|nr:hypothetical protein [Clostridia bacterium]
MSKTLSAKHEYERWLSYSQLDEASRQELEAIANDEEKIALWFTNPISFGTAGLRSTMHPGIACMNVYTVAQATRGIAALIAKENGVSRGVAIAYDSRNHSEEFARVSAEVLAANGIRSYLFDGVRPTPELSFAVRHLGCIAGINITASHNPKEYNGYKAYWEDGAQLSPEQSAVVAAAIADVDVLGRQSGGKRGSRGSTENRLHTFARCRLSFGTGNPETFRTETSLSRSGTNGAGR